MQDVPSCRLNVPRCRMYQAVGRTATKKFSRICPPKYLLSAYPISLCLSLSLARSLRHRPAALHSILSVLSFLQDSAAMTTATAAASLPSRRTTPTGISKKCFRAKVLKRHRELSEERDVRLCHCVCERERQREKERKKERKRLKKGGSGTTKQQLKSCFEEEGY